MHAVSELAASGASRDEVVNLVSAELGVSIVPASMMQVRVMGIVYRRIAGLSPTTQLALAYRRGETSPVVRNFVARAGS